MRRVVFGIIISGEGAYEQSKYHSGTARRGGSDRRHREAGFGSTPKVSKTAADWRNLKSGEKLCRLRAHGELCLTGAPAPNTPPPTVARAVAPE